MKKSTRINKIKNIAARLEQSTVLQMGLKQRKKQMELDKLNNLIKFRDDYCSQLLTIGAQGLSGKQLAQYRGFLGKMSEAIQQQGQTVDQVDRELVDSKSAWNRANQKTRSYGKLMDKSVAKELREQSKREQAEIDDRCKRKSRG